MWNKGFFFFSTCWRWPSHWQFVYPSILKHFCIYWSIPFNNHFQFKNPDEFNSDNLFVFHGWSIGIRPRCCHKYSTETATISGFIRISSINTVYDNFMWTRVLSLMMCLKLIQGTVFSDLNILSCVTHREKNATAEKMARNCTMLF